MLESFRRPLKPDESPVGFCANVMLPQSSLFNDDQLRALRKMGPRIYELRKKIFQAQPRDRLEVIDWMARLDSYHLRMCEIVNEATHDRTGNIDPDSVNW